MTARIPAENADGIFIVAVEGGSDFHPGTAHVKIENLIDLDFVAGADAAAAEDTLVQVSHDHRVGGLDGVAGGLDFETRFFDFQPVDEVLQLALPVGFTHQAVV